MSHRPSAAPRATAQCRAMRYCVSAAPCATATVAGLPQPATVVCHISGHSSATQPTTPSPASRLFQASPDVVSCNRAARLKQETLRASRPNRIDV
eukprot:354728-Chlamydomonas_euryale.AAC.12